MPILAKEPDIFPNALLDEETPCPVGELWYAIHTISRREKDLMRRLRSMRIAHYSPLAEKRKRSPSGRIRKSYLPLFRGYVFVRGSEEDRYNTVATGCVSNCLNVTDAAELVVDLQRIRLLTTAGADIRAEPRPLTGRRVVVISGPMTGVQGTISRTHSQHRLTVVVKFMQQGASVTVDEADIKLLG